MTPLLPTPPTDNLYKFMALSGIALLIAAPFFWAQFYITHFEKTHAAFQSLRASLPPGEYYFISGRMNSGETVTDAEKALVEKYSSLEKVADDAGAAYKLYDDFSRIITAIAGGIAGLGAVLAWKGFRLWYYRVQIQQDAILMQQCKLIQPREIDPST